MAIKKVMVVDDSKTICKLVKMSLELTGDYIIVEAKNGLGGIQKMADEKFDLIITDLRMPKMNGLEFISYVKKNSKLKDVPVVILTTEGSEEDKKRGLELGAVDYIVKPFQPLILQKIVKKLIG